MRIGTAIIGIGMIHVVFGFVVFPEVWLGILRSGVFNSIGEDPMRGAVAWFELFALPVFAYGQLINTLENSGSTMPGSIFWHLLVILLVGVVLMPVSGFWLLLLPLIMLWRRSRAEKNAVPAQAE